NQGIRDLTVCRTQQMCKLELDGKRYEHHEIVAKSSPFGPGKHYTDIHVSLYNRWRDPKTDRALKLVPGKHTIRIVFLPRPKDGAKPIRVVSNPVQIEIQPPPATQPAGQVSAKTVARQFLAAWRRGDHETMSRLQIKDRRNWWSFKAVNALARAARSKDAEQLTQIRETVVQGNWAAVRIDNPKGPTKPYLFLVLRRLTVGWRVDLIDESGPKMPAPALKEKLAEYVAILANIGRSAEWSQTVNGLQCRLLVLKNRPTQVWKNIGGVMRPVTVLQDHPVLELRNVSNKPITIPRYRDDLPVLNIRVHGYPDVQTPTSYSGGWITPHVLKPGQTFSYKISGNTGGNYLIAYGRTERGSGWIQFDPASKTYRLSAVMEWDKKEIRKSLGGSETVKCWTGRLVSNTVSLILPARPKPAKHWPATQPEKETEKINWGETVKGLQSGLSFDLQDRPYRVGELVSFRLHVRNTGKKDVTLADFVGGDPKNDRVVLISWSPSVRDSTGKLLRVSSMKIGMPVRKRVRTLAPGHTMMVGTILLKLDVTPE
ncbi:MAG: hypothetical protein KAV82_16925, partial [Phycisphaerae bacterium]|nr:hypothetical protein [Phycisphaerae bacterium]